MRPHRGGRLALEHVVFVGDEVHRAREGVEQARVALLGARDDLVADEGAEAVGVGVGGVLAPQGARLVAHQGHTRIGRGVERAAAQVIAQVAAAHVEAGAHDVAVGVAHRSKAARPRAHDRAHVEVFHPVVLGVGNEDAPFAHGHARLQAELLERFVGRMVALAAGHGFQVAARFVDEPSHVDVGQEEGHVERRGQGFHEGGIGVGVSPAQMVVHVQDAHRAHSARSRTIADQIGHSRGIRPARHHEQHGSRRTRQAAFGYRARHAFFGRFAQDRHDSSSFCRQPACGRPGAACAVSPIVWPSGALSKRGR